MSELRVKGSTYHSVRRRHPAWVLLVLLVLLLVAETAALAPPEPLYELSTKDLAADSGRIDLPNRWLFHPGDRPEFAARFFDDSGWQEVDTRLRDDDRPPEWDGMGWFRLRLRVDPDLRQTPLGLLLEQTGAAEIYLDGELLHTIGEVASRARDARHEIQRRPHLFAFDEREIHVLAIRFCNHQLASTETLGRFGGFVATLGDGNHRLAAYGQNQKSLSAFRAFFTGLFTAFALLHLLLYAFYRKATENLYFALLAGTVALLVHLFLHSYFTTDPGFLRLYDRAMNSAWILLVVFALRFVYSVFYPRPPKIFYALLALAAGLLIPGWLWPLIARPLIFVLLLGALAEMCRVVIVAIRRRMAGSVILGTGIVTLALGISIGLLAHLGVLPTSLWTTFLIPFCSVLLLVLSMSVSLSRQFARTNRELRQQLRQVRELSEHKLEQERLAREEKLQRQVLEIQYERKVEELEAARQLQLSMLPERLPELPDLEMAAGMITATEVGGDYYDFDLAGDGTLTLAIGDATGHGMKAGALVTATKSLFHAFAGERRRLPEILGHFADALRRMNLRQMSMALTLVRFDAGRLDLSAAGMPPALVYRAKTGVVEAVLLEGLPLGSCLEHTYRESNLRLAPGDTVLLMSDGLPERLNGRHDMLGYDLVTEAFSGVATLPPERIIDKLVERSEAWAEGEPAVDDMTFVVLKMRPALSAVVDHLEMDPRGL